MFGYLADVAIIGTYVCFSVSVMFTIAKACNVTIACNEHLYH